MLTSYCMIFYLLLHMQILIVAYFIHLDIDDYIHLHISFILIVAYFIHLDIDDYIGLSP